MRYPLKGLVFGWLAAAVTVHAATSSVAVDKVGIEDADTLLVDVAGTAYRIQLPDIDAPESVPNPKLQRDVERTADRDVGQLHELHDRMVAAPVDDRRRDDALLRDVEAVHRRDRVHDQPQAPPAGGLAAEDRGGQDPPGHP